GILDSVGCGHLPAGDHGRRRDRERQRGNEHCRGASMGTRAEHRAASVSIRRVYRLSSLLTSIAHTPRPCVAMTIMRSRGWMMKSMTLTDGRLPPSTAHRAPPLVVT